TEGVGLIAADLAGAPQTRPLLDLAPGVLAVEVGLRRTERGRGRGEGEGEPLVHAGAAGVFPLGLGRQTIFVTETLLRRQGGELAEELLRLLPGHVLDGEAVRVHALDLLLALAAGAEVRGVLAHDRLPLPLSDRIRAQPERPREDDHALAAAFEVG